MSILNSWEAEADEVLMNYPEKGMNGLHCERILALIDLIRKKDEALNFIIREIYPPEQTSRTYAINAINDLPAPF